MTEPVPTLVIPGGSGFLGRHIAHAFGLAGWRVIVLSRSAGTEAPTAQRSAIASTSETAVPIETVPWDGRTVGDWVRVLDGATAVLNLAGRSVNCRYHARNRAAILDSRVASTRVLGQAIAQVDRPPRVWLNSSTATIYRHAEDRPQDEFTGEIGSGFSIDVATAWEEAFFSAVIPGTVRRAALRTAMVMGRGRGGPFDVFLNLVRFRLGGRMGPGTQRVSWMHVHDFIQAVRFLIGCDDLAGVVNLVAPDVPTNAQFMATLRRAAGIRLGLPATRAMLELGAIFLRTETELPLKSRWAAPTRLRQAGFTFGFADWQTAVRDLVDAPPTRTTVNIVSAGM